MTRAVLLLTALASTGCVLDFDVLRNGRGERDAAGMDAFVEMPDVGLPDDGDVPDTGGGLDTGLPSDAGRDAPLPVDGGALCQRDAATCDDRLFCNGIETCMPGGDASTSGCLPGAPRCTGPMQACNETTDRCTTTCTDVDGDGSGLMPCGDDCADGDRDRYPGNTELCDLGAHRDEDCNCNTFGTRDMDGDGYTSDGCCNCVGTGDEACGNDCDDSLAAANPRATDPSGGADLNCDGTP